MPKVPFGEWLCENGWFYGMGSVIESEVYREALYYWAGPQPVHFVP